MYKACSRCGKVHAYNFKCNVGRVYKETEESRLRNKAAWKRKSVEIRERAQYLCEVCRDEGTYTYKGLEVHHITPIRENKNLLLDNFNLVCLCVTHHKQADAGEISAGYLRKLAKYREGR